MKKAIVGLVFLWLGGEAWARGFEDYDFEDDAPLPRREKVSPMAPDWCGDFQKPDGSETAERLKASVGRALESNFFSHQTLVTIARGACSWPDDAAVQQQVARWRQRHVNLTGLSEAEERLELKLRMAWADTNDLRDRWRDEGKKYCESAALKRVNNPSSDSADEINAAAREGALREMTKFAGGCKGDVFSREGASQDWTWWADGPAGSVPEASRAAAALACIDHHWAANGFPDPDDRSVQTSYAVCGATARRLDRARLEKEIEQDKLPELAKMNVRETFSRAGAVSEFLLEEYRGRKDEDLKALVLDAPEAGWLAWEKSAATWKAELDAAFAYETKFYGNSKKAKLGCSAELGANLRKYVASLKIVKEDDAKKLSTNDPVAFVLAEHLVACAIKEGNWFFAAQTFELVSNARPHRGPATAAFWSVVDALGKILEDKESFPITYAALGKRSSPMAYQLNNAWANQLGDGEEPASGEIKSAVKTGEGLKVTFTTVKITYDKMDCHDTRKLWRFDSNGTPLYFQDCKVVGKTTATISPDPVVVPLEVADKLAAGQVGTFAINATGGERKFKTRQGFPVTVYSDKGKKKVVKYYGLSL